MCAYIFTVSYVLHNSTVGIHFLWCIVYNIVLHSYIVAVCWLVYIVSTRSTVYRILCAAITRFEPQACFPSPAYTSKWCFSWNRSALV